MKEGNDMDSFTTYMKKRIIEVVNDTNDEDFLRTIYNMLNEIQISNAREKQDTLLEITGTC